MLTTNPQESVDLVTVTEEILNGKLHYLCIDILLELLRLQLCSIRFAANSRDTFKTLSNICVGVFFGK